MDDGGMKEIVHEIWPGYTGIVPFHFYLVRCSDGSLYSGFCVDIEQRLRKHNDGTGSKYTRSRRPVTIVHSESFATRGEALKREAEVKRWKKEQKELLITG